MNKFGDILRAMNMNEEVDKVLDAMKQRIVDEKESDTEYEEGCGAVDFYSLAEFFALARLVMEGFTDYDPNASEWTSKKTGYVWVC